MQVTVARVHESLFSGAAESLTVPTTEGTVTILPNHEPLVATLERGTLTVHTAEGAQTFPIEAGVVEVSNNQVTVLL